LLTSDEFVEINVFAILTGYEFSNTRMNEAKINSKEIALEEAEG